MKKSVLQMCPLACNFFKNSLSGVTVCGLVFCFVCQNLAGHCALAWGFFKVIFCRQVSGSNSVLAYPVEPVAV